MTEDAVRQRIETLKLGVIQLENNLAATKGALQDCQFWLEEIQKSKVQANGQALPEALEKRVSAEPPSA